MKTRRKSAAISAIVCFKDSTTPLLPKSEISSLKPSSVSVQPGLYRTWLELPKTGFIKTQLKSARIPDMDKQQEFVIVSVHFHGIIYAEVY